MPYTLLDDTPAPKTGGYTLLDDAPTPSPQAAPFGPLDALKAIGSSIAARGRDVINAAPDIGATLGQGVGNTALGVQKLIGKGVNMLTPQQATLSNLITGENKGNSVGNWLINDANQGREKLAREAAPSHERSPIAGGISKFVGEVLPTIPVGGGAAKLVEAVPLLSSLPGLANALRTSGFSTGLPTATTTAGKVGQMLLRSSAAAPVAAVSQMMIDGGTENAGTAAGIGALLPPALKTLGATGGLLAKGAQSAKNMFMPESAKTAGTILSTAGDNTLEAAQAMRNKLMPMGPSILPESIPTAPQLLQNQAISQLQRTVKAVGDTQIGEREAAQNMARLRGLDRISTVSGTVQQAAENLGNSVDRFALPANKNAADEVSKMYMGVDTAGESRIMPPIDRMQAAQQQFLRRGTFGSGSDARKAIQTAQDIGLHDVTEKIPLPQTPLPQKTLDIPPKSPGDSLLNDIRKMGGIDLRQIRDITGESRVGKGRPSLPPAPFKNGGVGIDDLASQLHAKGYDIPVNDVDGGAGSLRDMIRQELDGDKVYTMDKMEEMARHASSAQQEMSPLQYKSVTNTVPRPVPFDELQSLRSSIGEAANNAQRDGRNKEFGALSKMISEIDAGVEKVAAGRGEPSEYFPPEMVKRWRDANTAHAARINRFEIGPQAGMFRNGGDGQRSTQGAELAGKFFNSTRSQVEDMQAFHRLAGDNKNLLPMLKNYAVTDAANQTNRLGTLSNYKFNNWRNARSGALREAMSPEDMAMMNQVGRELKLSDAAEELGRSTGTDTVQKANNALKNGLIDNPLVSLIGGKVPLANNVLAALRASAKKTKAQELGSLLANPEELDSAIAQYMKWKQKGMLGSDAMKLGNKLAPTLYRAAPLLSSSQSSK